MDSIELGSVDQWSLGPLILGYDHPFLYVVKETVEQTWAVLILILILSLILRVLVVKNSIARFLVFSGITFLTSLVKQSLGYFSFPHFCFVAALFCFIALCNIIPLIPGFDEPTRDINTTLALSIIAFLYRTVYSIRAHGIKDFIADFFKPFFIMLPLNIIGELASIISLSFRLFGNIFGGSLITKLYFSTLQGSIIAQIFGLLSGVNFLITGFFIVFEGLLQAFVFSMLALTYLALETQEEGLEE
jgi:F-type H+-transporting ATPase subunit a